MEEMTQSADTDDALAGNKYVDVRTVVPDAGPDDYDPDQAIVDGPKSASVPWQMTISYASNDEVQSAVSATGGHLVE